MEFYEGNIACISYSELTDGIITESNYRNLCNRDKINVLRRGCYGTPALIEYDTLPQRIKDAVVEKYGSPYKMIPRNIVREVIAPDAEARKFFDHYRLTDGRLLPNATRDEYYANAIVLNAANLVANNRKLRVRSMGKGSISNVWLLISEAVNELSHEKYPHTLPTNDRRLKEKAASYRKGGYESLIHKNFCNKSAAKVDDDVKESLLIELIGDASNLDNEQIRALYNIVAERMNWKKITAGAVATWRDKYDLETYAGRRGATNLKSTRAMQVKRSKPTHPLYYWTADGWDAELLYQRATTNKEGHSVTTYHNRLTIVVVLDPCVNYPIGYAIGDRETPELITAAYRAAADHTKELFGHRYRSHQIQTDNYAKKALSPMYQAMADKYTPAEVKNAKAKVIEPYFKSLQKKYCQFMPNWSGFGVTSVKENQPNSDALNKHRRSFPDEAGCRQQLEFIMQREREFKREQYMKLWSAVAESDKLELSDEMYLSYFGQETERTIMMQGPGLRPMLLGQRRDYDCFDLNFRQHASTQWRVKFNPDDLSTILAENEDGTLRFTLQEKHIQPMALKDRQEGDYKQLEMVRDFNKGMISHITEVRAIAGETTEELMNDPRLSDTLTKLMLVDSNGQHKNELYGAKRGGLPPAKADGNEPKPKRLPKQVIKLDDEDEDETDYLKRMM